MNNEEYADKFMPRAKQDIKMCEEKHELEVYVAGLLENIDYWQNQYDYMKRHRDTLQEENKQLKEKIDKAIEEIDKILEIDILLGNGIIMPQRYPLIKEILKGE